MKSRFFLFVAIFAFGTLNLSLSAQNNPYTFTIHIGAFMDANISDFEEIRPFGYLYSNKQNNLNRIYMGDYTSESDAKPILAKVKKQGYIDAFITRRRLSEGGLVTVIQLGTEPVGRSIDWKKYANAGPLHVYQSGDNIAIVTGPIADLDEAEQRTNYLRTTRHAGAFIKNLNSVFLHPVTDFETGGSVTIPTNYAQVDIPENPKEEVVIAEIPAKKSPIPDFMVRKQAKGAQGKPANRDIPKTYENAGRLNPALSEKMTAKGGTTATKSNNSLPDTKITPPPALKKSAAPGSYAMPSIRGKVKRTSALKLQEVLKEKGVYNNGLDGYYGAGTKKAYAKVLAEDQELQKYKLLTDLYKSEETKVTELERIITAMDQDVALAVGRLKGYRGPIADIFQAYGIFELAGANAETNRLMNQAIKASFGNRKFKNKRPFDYSKTYAYANYDQLIQHIRYVYGVSEENIPVPCWLFAKHPDEMSRAFDSSNHINSEDYVIQDCGNITAWESIQLLETIMKDMTPDLTAVDQKNINRAQSTRAQLLLNPKAQSVLEYKAIDLWNNKLWKGLEQWEDTDPLHSRIATPLRITYFQSWALLEDHFMNKGLKPKEARGLGLEVLQTIVDPYLARYSME